MKYVVVVGESWRAARFEFAMGSAALAVAEQLAEHHVPEKDEDDFMVKIIIEPDPVLAVDAAIENNAKEDEEV